MMNLAMTYPSSLQRPLRAMVFQVNSTQRVLARLRFRTLSKLVAIVRFVESSPAPRPIAPRIRAVASSEVLGSTSTSARSEGRW